jgi:hypothetical protein
VASTLKPWEQRPDESAQAYAGFEVYRKLGPKRTIDKAGLIIAPPDEGAQKGRKRGATGRIREWAKRFDWASRARAWDERRATVHTQAVEQETRRQGRRFAQIRDQILVEGIERWLNRLKQSDLAAAMPLTTQTVHRDGKTVVIEATDLEVHRKAMVIASKSQERLLELVDRGLAIESAVAAEVAERETSARPVGEVSAAEKRLEAWRAAQRKAYLTLSPVPPDDPPDDSTTE